MTKMTKYQLEHFENKVNRYFQPLIEEQSLLIKQYRTEATNNVVKKLIKGISTIELWINRLVYDLQITSCMCLNHYKPIESAYKHYPC